MEIESKDLHDLSGVCIDFKILLELLQTGYRFDDEQAPELLKQLEHSVKVLEAHVRDLAGAVALHFEGD
jgi:hypothetical protein